MAKPVAVTGNEACAEALRQINPDVCAAYPITPATDLMQRFAGFVNDIPIGIYADGDILQQSNHTQHIPSKRLYLI